MGTNLVVIAVLVGAWLYSKHEKKKLAWIQLEVIRKQQELGECWCNTRMYHLSEWERRAFQLGIYLPDSYNTMSRLGWSQKEIQDKIWDCGNCYQANLDRWCDVRDTP